MKPDVGVGRARGQVLIIMALLLTALLGMTGVAVDLGYGYAHRREVQNAADAGAMAGALALGRHILYTQLSTTDRAALGLTSDPFPSDAAIFDEIETAAAASAPPFPAPSSSITWPSGAGNSLQAFYILADGSQTAIGGGGAPPNNAVGVRVEARLSFPTYFARILGPCCTDVPVLGTARANLVPSAGPSGADAPFIVCGGNGTEGALLAPSGAIVSPPLLTGSNPKQVDYVTHEGRTFVVHWSQLGQNGGGCGNGNQFKGLADPNDTCDPVGSTPLPCNLDWDNGTRAGPTRSRVAGMPGCNGDEESGGGWDNCVLVLPVSDGCAGPTCRIVAWAPFRIIDGRRSSQAPSTGCQRNCHLGTLLPAGITDGNAGTGTFDPNNPGLFTVKLVP